MYKFTVSQTWLICDDLHSARFLFDYTIESDESSSAKIIAFNTGANIDLNWEEWIWRIFKLSFVHFWTDSNYEIFKMLSRVGYNDFILSSKCDTIVNEFWQCVVFVFRRKVQIQRRSALLKQSLARYKPYLIEYNSLLRCKFTDIILLYVIWL